MYKKNPVSVFTRLIEQEEINTLLHYPARLRAKIHSTVLSESDGIITKIEVTLGKRVKAQQILMILNHTDPVYQYAPVQIRSPIHGLISSIDVAEGSQVLQGQKLVSVINPSELEVQIEVPAQEISLLKKNMQGELKILEHKTSFTVQISGISPFVDPNTGTALVQLNILPQKKEIFLSPGMQGQVEFKAKKHRGFLVPASSLIYKDKETFVYLVEGQKIKQVPVTLGTQQNGVVEILTGLFVGAELVERSSRFATEGETVVIEK